MASKAWSVQPTRVRKKCFVGRPHLCTGQPNNRLPMFPAKSSMFLWRFSPVITDIYSRCYCGLGFFGACVLLVFTLPFAFVVLLSFVGFFWHVLERLAFCFLSFGTINISFYRCYLSAFQTLGPKVLFNTLSLNFIDPLNCCHSIPSHQITATHLTFFIAPFRFNIPLQYLLQLQDSMSSLCYHSFHCRTVKPQKIYFFFISRSKSWHTSFLFRFKHH